MSELPESIAITIDFKQEDLINEIKSLSSTIERLNKIVAVAKEAFNEINFPKIWLDGGSDRVLKLSREALTQITEIEKSGEKECDK